MRIEDCENYTSPAFRHRVENFWANYKGSGQFLTLGACLATIKTHKLWEKWGHHSFSDYCRKELHLTPFYHENIYICVYVRLKAIGMEPEDMRSAEGVGNFKRSLIISKYVRTKAEFFRVFRKYKHQPITEVKHALTHPRGRTRNFLIPSHLPKSLVDTMEVALANVAGFFEVEQEYAPRIMAIVTSALIYKNVSRDKLIKRMGKNTWLTKETTNKIIQLLKEEI